MSYHLLSVLENYQRIPVSFWVMNIHANAPSTLNNYMNKFSRLYLEKRLYLSGTFVLSYLIVFPYANRVDPDQAALTRAA